jgi:hypothetical protein
MIAIDSSVFDLCAVDALNGIDAKASESDISNAFFTGIFPPAGSFIGFLRPLDRIIRNLSAEGEYPR